MKLLLILLFFTQPKDTTHKCYHWYDGVSRVHWSNISVQVDTIIATDNWLIVDNGKPQLFKKGDTIIKHSILKPKASLHLYSNPVNNEPVIDTIICKVDDYYKKKGDTTFIHHYQYGDFTDEQVRKYKKQ